MYERPSIPDEDYGKPIGSELPERPDLPLLPEREWLGAKLVKCDYRISIFNKEVQYITNKQEEPIRDEAGNKIPRREFNITFEFKDYKCPDESPRKAWLAMGASMGQNAHLPVFLANLLPGSQLTTPSDIIGALEGLHVKLQLENKPRKDPAKQPRQQVIYSAVRKIDDDSPAETPEPAPIRQGDTPF